MYLTPVNAIYFREFHKVVFTDLKPAKLFTTLPLLKIKEDMEICGKVSTKILQQYWMIYETRSALIVAGHILTNWVKYQQFLVTSELY